MILSILKIIGLILLIILAIVLALILLVLFVPIIYKGNVDSADGCTKANVNVTWLFRFIRFEFLLNTADDTKTLTDLYIAGISLKKLKASMTERKKAKRKKHIRKKLKKLSGSDPKKYQELKEKALEKKRQKELLQNGLTDESAESDVSEDATTADAEISENADTADAETSEITGTAAVKSNDIKDQDELIKTDHSSKKKENKITDAEGLWKITRRILTFLAKILLTLGEILRSILKKAGTFFSNFGDKLKNIAHKIRYWQKFIMDPDTWKAVSVVLIKSKKLIRHILPRCLSGNILFGTGDPYTTGTALAAAEAFYPLWCDKFEVSPDFENKIIEGQASFKGRIFIFYTAYLVLTAYFNRSVKKTISYIRQE